LGRRVGEFFTLACAFPRTSGTGKERISRNERSNVFNKLRVFNKVPQFDSCRLHHINTCIFNDLGTALYIYMACTYRSVELWSSHGGRIRCVNCFAFKQLASSPPLPKKHGNLGPA